MVAYMLSMCETLGSILSTILNSQIKPLKTAYSEELSPVGTSDLVLWAAFTCYPALRRLRQEDRRAGAMQ